MDLVLDVNKLEIEKLYKVVQITINGEPIICFADEQNGRTCHFMILEEILRTRSMPYDEIKVRYGTGPNTRGASMHGTYFVSGMGIARLGIDGVLRFGGDSKDYKMGICKDHIEDFLKKNPGVEMKVQV